MTPVVKIGKPKIWRFFVENYEISLECIRIGIIYVNIKCKCTLYECLDCWYGDERSRSIFSHSVYNKNFLHHLYNTGLDQRLKSWVSRPERSFVHHHWYTIIDTRSCYVVPFQTKQRFLERSVGGCPIKVGLDSSSDSCPIVKPLNDLCPIDRIWLQ